MHTGWKRSDFTPWPLLGSLMMALATAPWSARALVDYSEKTEDGPTRIALKAPSKAGLESSSRGPLGHSAFDFGTHYESVSVANGPGDGQVGLIQMNGHFQTPFNVYTDINYWMGQTSDAWLSEDNGYQKGNGTLKLGLNWLHFGSEMEQASVDFIGGVMLPEKKSALASSRFDKIAGVDTVKRFYDFAVGLGYQMTFTGNPSRASELAIGNIQKLQAAIGWEVSSDIRFEVEAAQVTVGAAKAPDRPHFLSEKAIYGYVAPQAHLGIARFMALTLGARFMTRKMETKDNILDAKLWGNEGSYGTTLFTGLNISL